MRTLSLVLGVLFLLAVAVSPVRLTAQENAKETQTAEESGSNPDHTKRLQRLEEQIVDLSAQLGTVETLARGGGETAGGGASPTEPGTVGGGDTSRLGSLEMEVHTLSAKMNDLVNRLQHLESRQGIVSPSQQPAGAQGNEYTSADTNGNTTQPAGQGIGGNASPSGAGNTAADNDGFSATRVEQERTAAQPKPKKKSSGGFFGLFGSDDEEEEKPAQTPPRFQPMRQPATEPSDGGSTRIAAASSPQAQSLYDTAYADLMQRNYRAATKGFKQFVQRFPNSPRAGSAHFWLGEASFTNGEYRKAADNFLKCATDFPNSEKAAESLLKLGISLKRLHEKDAACSTFNELARRFPNAATLLKRAETEKRRTGC